ncbi:MAG TPA: sulfite exporter TauE/SafE family protein [Syntrophobacteraceae bacterium]|nr:sulfite exporter TauE/SafE family protein [Syntrophobacteraceae bacterium]
MNKKGWMIVGLIVAVALVGTAIWTEPGMAGKLEDAISQAPVGTGKGMIDPKAEPGFMGIPGAPKTYWILNILWGIWVGWIFSSVGAFGGVMAGVGHITVFGLADYGKSFKQTCPVLNKLLTDSVRVCNQYLVGASAMISSTTYYRMGRLVLPLGLCLAGGGMLGAYLIPTLTAGKVDFSSYVGYFGIVVFLVAGVLFYETTPRGQASRKAAKQAAKAFEDANIRKTAGTEGKTDSKSLGVHITHLGIKKITFTFYGVEFSFNPLWPVVGGFVIAAISAFIGVGGGFLYVPFLTSVAGLPMFIVAGTSALAVLVSMITSIFTFMFMKSIPVDFPLISTEMIGVFIGSVLGPVTSKYIPEVWLKRLFVVLALYVGIGYTTKGFMGRSILPGL